MSCYCPDNYFFNADTGLCERIVDSEVTLNQNPKSVSIICGDTSFMNFGTLIYPLINVEQFPILGNNELPPIYIDSFDNSISSLANIISPMWISGESSNYGRLNQVGIGLNPPINDWQGYLRCIYVGEGDVYSIGLASNFGFRVYIDGQLAIYYKPSNINPAAYMQIFPLNLTEGQHTILFEGLSGPFNTGICKDINDFEIECSSEFAVYPPINCPNLGVFLAEIYLNITPQILSDIQNQQELNTFYAKSSVNGINEFITTALLKGNPTDTGVNGNYKCSTGYMYACLEGKIICRDILTVSPSACCFRLIDCEGGEDKFTTSNLTAYLSKTIKIEGSENCYLVNTSDSGCSGALPVVVDSYYDSCIVCLLKYYKLIDCTGEVSSIITKTDLLDYLGKTVKIEGYNNVCWIVGRSDESSNIEVEISQFFNNCQECI